MTKAKHFILYLMAVMLAVGVGGCGKKESDVVKEPTPQEKPTPVNPDNGVTNKPDDKAPLPVQNYITKIKASENLRVVNKEQSKNFSLSSNSSLTVSNDYMKSYPIKVGDIICLPPTKDNIFGFAGKVTEVIQSDGPVQLKTEIPALDEVFDELDLDIDGLPYSEPLFFDAYGNLVNNTSLSKSSIWDAIESGYDWFVDKTTFDVLDHDIHIKDAKVNLEISDKADKTVRPLFGLLGQEEPVFDKDKYSLSFKFQNKVSVDMEQFKLKIGIDPVFGLRHVSCNISNLTITDEASIEVALKRKWIDFESNETKKDANKKEFKIGYLVWPLPTGPIPVFIQVGVYASLGVDATFSLKRSQTYTVKVKNVSFVIDKIETLNMPKITQDPIEVEKSPMKTTFSVDGEISAGIGFELPSVSFVTLDNKLGLKTDLEGKINAQFEMEEETSDEGSSFTVDLPSAEVELDYHIKAFCNFKLAEWCKFKGDWEIKRADKKPLWKWEGYILPKFSDFELIADNDTRIGSYKVTKNNFFGGLMTDCEYGIQYLDARNNVLYDYKDEYVELPQERDLLSTDSEFGSDQKYQCCHTVFDSKVFYARNYIKFPFWVPFSDGNDTKNRYFYYNYQNFPLPGVASLDYALSAQTVEQNATLTLSGSASQTCIYEISVGGWGETLPLSRNFSVKLPTSVAGTHNGKIVATKNGEVVAEKNFSYTVSSNNSSSSSQADFGDNFQYDGDL